MTVGWCGAACLCSATSRRECVGQNHGTFNDSLMFPGAIGDDESCAPTSAAARVISSETAGRGERFAVELVLHDRRRPLRAFALRAV